MSGVPDITRVCRVEDVFPDPKQPRTYFKPSAIKSLANSIKLVGQRTPIEVKKLPNGKYQIIDGERRWRACKLAGIDTIRINVEVEKLDARKQHLLSVISNFHREGHTHMEISRAVAYQVQLGTSVGDLARNLNKSTAWVYQYLSLQKLDQKLQDAMHPEVPKATRLRFGEAVVIASLPAMEQQAAYDEMQSVNQKERLTFLRKHAEASTGLKRKGRERDIPKMVATTLMRIKADLGFLMDTKQGNIRKAVLLIRTYDVRQIVETLHELGQNINPIINELEEAQMIGSDS